MAAKKGHLEDERVVSNKADCKNAIKWAARKNHIEIVKLLLENTNLDSKTTLKSLIGEGSEKFIFDLPSARGFTVFYTACSLSNDPNINSDNYDNCGNVNVLNIDIANTIAKKYASIA